MIHLIVALHCEAKPLIDYFKLKLQEQSPFEIYQNATIKLIISKVGCFNAASATSYLGAQSKNALWLNIGLAGHLSAKVGSLFLVSKIAKESNKAFYPYLPIKQEVLRSSLLTLDKPCQEYQEDLLYDMEGYGFYFAASKFTTLERVQLLKIVSDGPKVDLKSITSSVATSLIQSQLDSIHAFIENFSSLNSSSQQHPDLDLFLNHWSFSQTERLKASKLINLIYLHKADPLNFQELQKLSSKKELFQKLEEFIFNLKVGP